MGTGVRPRTVVAVVVQPFVKSDKSVGKEYCSTLLGMIDSVATFTLLMLVRDYCSEAISDAVKDRED